MPMMAGLLVPASLTGLRPRSGQNTLVATWYTGLTGLALAFAYRGHGLDRIPGAAIIAVHLVFVAGLIISMGRGKVDPAPGADCLPRIMLG